MANSNLTNEPKMCVLEDAIKQLLDQNGPAEYGPDNYDVKLLPTGVVRIVKQGDSPTLIGFVPLHHVKYMK